MSASAVPERGIKRSMPTEDQADNETTQTAKRVCQNPLDNQRIPDDHRDQMEDALSNLTAAQIKNLLIQASWQDVVVKNLALAASESIKAKRRQDLPAEFGGITTAVQSEIMRVARDRDIILDDEKRRSYRSVAEGIKQIVQEGVVKKVDPSDSYETKIRAIECLIDLAQAIPRDEHYVRLSEVIMKRGVPDCIVDGIFQIRKTLMANEMDETLSERHILTRTTQMLNYVGSHGLIMRENWRSLFDVHQLFTPPSKVLHFGPIQLRVQDALCLTRQHSKDDKKADSKGCKHDKTAGHVRRELETSIQRGIIAKLGPKSFFETRQKALITLIWIGNRISMARRLRHHHGALDDKYLDSIVTDSMEFVLALSPEEKRKEEYNLYCSSEDLSAVAGDNVKRILQQMSLQCGDSLPGLPSILRQLGVPTLTQHA
jgi:hypothetical protein